MARSKSTPRKRNVTKRGRSKRKSIRSKPTNRVSTASRARKKSTTTSGFTAHHAVRVRPFSNATSQPKIPDGALTSSLSRRLQNVVPFRNANGSQGNLIMHLIFAPTLGVPLCITNTVDGVAKRSGSGSDPQFIGFPQQTVGFTPIVLSAPKWPLTGTDVASVTNTGGFSKWRIVSQGLRMELNAVDDENDGWFEACRMNWRNENRDISITPLDGSTNDTTVGVAPNPNRSDLFNMPMVEQPGYKTGLLKDIKKYEFMLHPQKTDHDPIDLALTNTLKAGTDVSIDTNAFKLDLEETAAATNFKNETVDRNMDWIYIRFHPRDANANGSGIILNVIQNLEIGFDPSSDFASFQTINKMDPKHAKVTDTLNNNSDAFNGRHGVPVQQVNYEIYKNTEDPPNLVAEGNVQTQEFEKAVALKEQGDPSYWSMYMRDSDLSGFKAQAYTNPDGIAIRVNPVTGKKELFIAGTRDSGEWAQNVLEGEKAGLGWLSKVVGHPIEGGGLGSLARTTDLSGEARDAWSQYIDELIVENNVEVVYGHSRGGATLSGLKSDVTKIGLDAATSIGHEHQDWVNLRNPAIGGAGFDAGLSIGYKHNLVLKDTAFHDVTRHKGTSVEAKEESKASLARRRSRPKPWFAQATSKRIRTGGQGTRGGGMKSVSSKRKRSDKPTATAKPSSISTGKKQIVQKGSKSKTKRPKHSNDSRKLKRKRITKSKRNKR